MTDRPVPSSLTDLLQQARTQNGPRLRPCLLCSHPHYAADAADWICQRCKSPPAERTVQ